MARRFEVQEEPEKSAKWLATFNDMVTLLLTFFVLILSMSDMDSGKVMEMTRSVSGAFGTLKPGDKGDISIFDPFVTSVVSRGMGEKKRKEMAGAMDKIEGMDAKVVKDEILITLEEKLLYRSGLAEIEGKAYRSLNSLCSELQKTAALVKVEGHTDNVPIETPEFPSNWELSVARAVNVVRYFISEGGISPERLSAAGYADSKPVAPNTSEDGRAQNRRVEIILTSKEG